MRHIQPQWLLPTIGNTVIPEMKLRIHCLMLELQNSGQQLVELTIHTEIEI